MGVAASRSFSPRLPFARAAHPPGLPCPGGAMHQMHQKRRRLFEFYAKSILTKNHGYGKIITVARECGIGKTLKSAALAHLVERHLAKVEVASSSLVSRSTFGSLAQLGEHLPYKQRVTGSSPVTPTIFPGPVVQLVRTLACHARGREFEPHPGRHFMPL